MVEGRDVWIEESCEVVVDRVSKAVASLVSWIDVVVGVGYLAMAARDAACDVERGGRQVEARARQRSGAGMGGGRAAGRIGGREVVRGGRRRADGQRCVAGVAAAAGGGVGVACTTGDDGREAQPRRRLERIAGRMK